MKNPIIFVDNSLWGLLNFRGYIISKLLDDGHQVILVAPDGEFGDVKMDRRAIFHPVELTRTGTNLFSEIKYIIKLYRIVKNYRPSLVISYTIKPNIYCSIISKLNGIPNICVVTGLGYIFTKKTTLSKCFQKLYVKTLNIASSVFLLNEGNLESLKKIGFLVKKTVHVLPGGEGINVENHKINSMPRTADKDVFLMVARVLYDKGYNEFVYAATNLADKAEFILIGAIDSNPNAVPRDIVLGETSIKYVPFLPKEDVLNWMRRADCIILPSYHEGMSATLMEAAALGKPIITTNISGCKEIVRDYFNGFLVPARDSQALLSACKSFINSSVERKLEMGKNSRQIAEETFDIKDVLKKYQDVITFLQENK